MPDKRRLFIDGRRAPTREPHDPSVVDPSTEEVCATVPLGGEADADLALAAAKRSFGTWPRTEPAERPRLVERLLEVHKRRAPDMAKAISTGMGTPIDMARARQAGAGAHHIQALVDAFRSFELLRPLGPHAPHDRIPMDPIGVVGHGRDEPQAARGRLALGDVKASGRAREGGVRSIEEFLEARAISD